MPAVGRPNNDTNSVLDSGDWDLVQRLQGTGKLPILSNPSGPSVANRNLTSLDNNRYVPDPLGIL